jgi:hypothetical protein
MTTIILKPFLRFSPLISIVLLIGLTPHIGLSSELVMVTQFNGAFVAIAYCGYLFNEAVERLLPHDSSS